MSIACFFLLYIYLKTAIFIVDCCGVTTTRLAKKRNNVKGGKFGMMYDDYLHRLGVSYDRRQPNISIQCLYLYSY